MRILCQTCPDLAQTCHTCDQCAQARRACDRVLWNGGCNECRARGISCTRSPRSIRIRADQQPSGAALPVAAPRAAPAPAAPRAAKRLRVEAPAPQPGPFAPRAGSALPSFLSWPALPFMESLGADKPVSPADHVEAEPLSLRTADDATWESVLSLLASDPADFVLEQPAAAWGASAGESPEKVLRGDAEHAVFSWAW